MKNFLLEKQRPFLNFLKLEKAQFIKAHYLGLSRITLKGKI
jgi:hypothetical protein